MSEEALSGARTAAFLIRKDQINSAWTYLQVRYGGKDLFLRRTDPASRAEFFSEIRYEEYFDTPDLALLAEGKAIRYSVWADAPGTEPGAKNEVAEILVPDVQGLGLDPGRTGAFGIILGDRIRFEVAHYKATTSPDEKHRLLSVIKRAVRQAFKEVIRKLGIDNPLYLVNVLNVESRRAGFNIITGDNPVGKIYLEEATAEKFGVGAMYALLRFVPDPSWTTVPAGAETASVAKAVEADLLRNLHVTVRVCDGDYQLAFTQLNDRFPFLKLLLKYPLIKKCGEIVLMSLFGFVVLVLFFHKRLFSANKARNLEV